MTQEIRTAAEVCKHPSLRHFHCHHFVRPFPPMPFRIARTAAEHTVPRSAGNRTQACVILQDLSASHGRMFRQLQHCIRIVDIKRTRAAGQCQCHNIDPYARCRRRSQPQRDRPGSVRLPIRRQERNLLLLPYSSRCRQRI